MPMTHSYTYMPSAYIPPNPTGWLFFSWMCVFFWHGYTIYKTDIYYLVRNLFEFLEAYIAFFLTLQEAYISFFSGIVFKYRGLGSGVLSLGNTISRICFTKLWNKIGQALESTRCTDLHFWSWIYCTKWTSSWSTHFKIECWCNDIAFKL